MDIWRFKKIIQLRLCKPDKTIRKIQQNTSIEKLHYQKMNLETVSVQLLTSFEVRS